MAEQKVVSLKRTREDITALVDEGDKPYFPHSLYLDDEDIEKLQLAGLALGDERQLAATVRVVEVSTNADEGRGKRSNMTLSLTEGAVAQPSKSVAERLFGGNDGGDQ